MQRLLMIGVLVAFTGCSAARQGTPAAEGQRYVIFFQAFSANLDDTANGAIRAAADSAKAHPGVPITVAGYASTIGSNAANAALAKTRAQVVVDGLVGDGVDAARIKNHGLGETDFTLDPIESRRVEISVGI